MSLPTLQNTDLTNKIAVLRGDLNVPVRDGIVTDMTRIDRLAPTIKHLVTNAKQVIILSHFGRPENKNDKQYSLAFLAPVLSKRWGLKVDFSDNYNKTPENKIVLMENTRFFDGENENNADLAQKFASLGDIFVNDAFSVSHRAHASTVGIGDYIPGCAGFLMEEEINTLTSVLENPARPMGVVIGGSKISTKLNVLHNLVKKADVMVLGGGMANTFLAAQGYSIGASLFEESMLDEAKSILESAKVNDCNFILPIDGVVSKIFGEGQSKHVVDVNNIPDDQMMLDIGPKSVGKAIDALSTCQTLIWNGPVGAFEIKPFDEGTLALADFIAEQTQENGAVSVAGGGDTIAAIKTATIEDDISYISTAGGAFLEWLEGKALPAVEALKI